MKMKKRRKKKQTKQKQKHMHTTQFDSIASREKSSVNRSQRDTNTAHNAYRRRERSMIVRDPRIACVRSERNGKRKKKENK